MQSSSLVEHLPPPISDRRRSHLWDISLPLSPPNPSPSSSWTGRTNFRHGARKLPTSDSVNSDDIADASTCEASDSMEPRQRSAYICTCRISNSASTHMIEEGGRECVREKKKGTERRRKDGGRTVDGIELVDNSEPPDERTQRTDIRNKESRWDRPRSIISTIARLHSPQSKRLRIQPTVGSDGRIDLKRCRDESEQIA